MRILLTGATGFIGKKLSKRLLLEGHSLVLLVRDLEKAKQSFPYPADFFLWNAKDEPDPAAFTGVDGVIHLAGESIVGARWSEAQKRKIHDSRILSARALVSAMEKLGDAKPQVFLGASAIGFYGDRKDEVLDEQSPLGAGFLSEICRDWESEVLTKAIPGLRSVAVRIGIVLGKGGGALEKLLPLFKKGMGGPIGSGSQWMSWIHIDDLVSVFLECLENSKLVGPINAVAPEAVTNRDFSKALGEALQTSVFFTAPAAALKLAMGEMSTAVLGSTRVKPARLLQNGFRFKFSRIEQAFSEIVQGVSNDEVEYLDELWVPHELKQVFEYFGDAKNLEAITPPWLNFKIVSMSTPEIREGTLIDYKLKVHGFPMKWRTLIEDWTPGIQFIDTQLKGPYKKWHHTHRFSKLAKGTLIEDRVIYRLPGGLLGSALMGGKIKQDVTEIFKFRTMKIRERFN